jgi:AcrR family transcriptional regulator
MLSDGKNRIIEAAQRLISAQGVDKTSMRAIAEEAGITTGAIYYYYKSKEELLYDVMDYAMSITATLIKRRRESTASQEDLLEEIYSQVTQRLTGESARRLRFYLAYQAALGEGELRKKFVRDYLAQADRTAELFNFVFGLPPQAQDRCLAVIMVAALDGINLQQFVGALPVNRAEIAEVYNEFFTFAIPGFVKHIQEKQKKNTSG